ncbi:hypothetical protein ACF1AY_08350 [Streptomyces sp. NPDC014776]|uniref:hypothetical protein n=1 Tax=unclassified Streptomyces TaxID=2593676 RepID=UPI0036FA4D23
MVFVICVVVVLCMVFVICTIPVVVCTICVVVRIVRAVGSCGGPGRARRLVDATAADHVLMALGPRHPPVAPGRVRPS